MNVELPDGSKLELPEGASGADAAAAIGAGLARAALGIRVDGELADLLAPLHDGARIEIVTAKSEGQLGEDALWLVRHDAAHVLATAVTELYPGTKVSIGPPIENGFYYDFEFPEGVSISDGDFEAIEQKMREHIKADEEFERSDLAVADAVERFKAEDQPYKVELIEDLARDQGVETVSLYRNGPFTDLCRGPHAPGTSRIKAFKLTSVAGAYWRGDEKRQMLTRIYGTAFLSKEALALHLERLEQARARDHRKLGRELGLFLFRQESPGMPFWLPGGMVIQNEVRGAVREQLVKRGYQEIATPHVLDEELWHRSGHYDNYRENMFFSEVDGRRFAIRPMNCPGACLVFGSGRHSYRDLPLRLAEFGQVSRWEREGVLHGLLRVRAFTQDDAHVYCTLEQIADEVQDIVRAIDELYALFGFTDVRVELSTRPEKSIGSDETWEKAEELLKGALEGLDREYQLNAGDGAFYGPKIDFHITDALGRSWQCGTCQLDFFMPERFDLSYTGADNADHRPVMIHRALLGSVERFIGILIEHHAGDLPLWLAPLQALVLPVSDQYLEYARKVGAELLEAGIRVEVDERGESVGRKIRDGELRKAPFMLIVGEREQEAGEVSVRRHTQGDTGAVPIAAFIELARTEIDSRATQAPG
ncbi:MAG: threonyl-tRNA synthetase [Thermoleophilaceae bacterium]|nr:threonyl-tRNA synthetase [Thermoleophilaceae bacterium]